MPMRGHRSLCLGSPRLTVLFFWRNRIGKKRRLRGVCQWTLFPEKTGLRSETPMNSAAHPAWITGDRKWLPGLA